MTLKEAMDLHARAYQDLELAKADLKHFIKSVTIDRIENDDELQFAKTVARLQQEIVDRKKVVDNLAELNLDIDVELTPYQQLEW